MDLCQLPGLMTQASQLAKLEPVQPQTRAASVAAVDSAGIKILSLLYTGSTKMVFYHPKYYKELRKRNKSDQAISYDDSTESQGVRPGPGLKQQATSYKLPGPRPISNANKGLIHKQQASSKPEPVQVQASSAKRQASQPE